MSLDLTETEVQLSNQPLYRWGYLVFVELIFSRMMFLWVITVCTLVGGYQCFRGMCCIHHPYVLSQPRRPLSKSSLRHTKNVIFCEVLFQNIYNSGSIISYASWPITIHISVIMFYSRTRSRLSSQKQSVLHFSMTQVTAVHERYFVNLILSAP